MVQQLLITKSNCQLGYDWMPISTLDAACSRIVDCLMYLYCLFLLFVASLSHVRLDDASTVFSAHNKTSGLSSLLFTMAKSRKASKRKCGGCGQKGHGSNECTNHNVSSFI